jgi:hypothetical protein
MLLILNATLVTGHEGPQGYESRLPYFLDNWLTHIAMRSFALSTDQLPSIPRKIPGTHFCDRLGLNLGS